MSKNTQWVEICPLARIVPDRGVCALVGGEQVAVFRVSPDDRLYAVSNFDPFSKANVMSRGIIGSRGAVVKVASPIYKQCFDLATGNCLDDPTVTLRTYPVRLEGSIVKVALARAPGKRSAWSAKEAAGVHAARARPESRPLRGITVALAETRELALLQRMLTDRGAEVLAFPLVRVVDPPDAAPVTRFLSELVEHRIDAVVLSTGEGVRRLLGFARRMQQYQAVVSALARVTTVTRGPKPSRALREVGILPTLPAEVPTTDGLIDALQSREWRDRRVGVQLCGGKPNPRLVEFLKRVGAEPCVVAPYLYAQASEDDRVIQLIRYLSTGSVDVVAFTCSAQVERLYAIAQANRVEDALRRGLRRTRVAAIGPVVAAALRDRGATVDIVPQRSFFMRSLLNEIASSAKAKRIPLSARA